MKSKLPKFKITASSLILVLAGVVAVVGLAVAAESLVTKNIVVQGNYIEAPVPVTQVTNEVVGALPGPDIASLYLAVNGDTEYHIVAPFKDTTTTITSFVNPFGTSATTTVELARLQFDSIVPVTSTFHCGASADGLGAPEQDIITSGSVASNTYPYMIENNLTNTFNSITGGTVGKIVLTPTYPYFVCFASTTDDTLYTTSTETFAGKATVLINNTR